MGKRVNSEQFGLFASEAEILDLSDGGMDAWDIAKMLGKRRGYVEAIIERYHGGGGAAGLSPRAKDRQHCPQQSADRSF